VKETHRLFSERRRLWESS